MNRIEKMAAFIALLGGLWAQTQKPDAIARESPGGEPRPNPEMQRLFDTFAGTWHVRETFEVATSRGGKMREGTASFRVGAGYSLIEDYRSTGSAGPLRFLAVLWWDPPAHVYRLLTCANNDGCELRGTARWEGNEFVNSWEEKVDGKTGIFNDSFVDIRPSSFRLVSEGKAGGKTIWRYDEIHAACTEEPEMRTTRLTLPAIGCLAFLPARGHVVCKRGQASETAHKCGISP